MFASALKFLGCSFEVNVFYFLRYGVKKLRGPVGGNNLSTSRNYYRSHIVRSFAVVDPSMGEKESYRLGESRARALGE